MLRRILTIIVYAFFVSSTFAQVVETKVIDNGGSGPFKALAVTEKTLPDFVIYRPEDIRETVKEMGRLPILVWANGGCMNSSIHHERLLTEIASQGYVIVAIGGLQMAVADRIHEHTPDDEMLKAIDWITERANAKESDYYKNVNLEEIAAGGQSCGGAQTFRIAADRRIKTYMIFNAGMGDMTMAGASQQSLKNLHGEVIYLLGGESDVAYENALLDYDRIADVPVVFANHETAGHGGTFADEFGGSFARMAIDWLDWQFREKDNSDLFLNYELDDYPEWTMKAKNFSTQEGDPSAQKFEAPDLEFVCEIKVTIGAPIELGTTPRGKKVIIPITGGTFAGPELRGTVLKGGADYQYISSNEERTELNATYTIKTDDNVLIHVQNQGILHTPKAEQAATPGTVYFKAAPKFEAPTDSKYAWLNNALFICNPVGKDGYISVQVWKVR